MSSNSPFDWRVPTRIAFRPNNQKTSGAETAALGSRALIVTDTGCQNAGLVHPVMRDLANAGLAVDVIEINGPNRDSIDQIVAAAIDTASDVLVAIGGGSVMDPTKVASLALRNPELKRSFATGLHPLDPLQLRPAIPVVCIPTTPATGSEVNGVALIFYEKAPSLLFGGELLPRTAIVDPRQMHSYGRAKLQLGAFEVFCRLLVPWVASPGLDITDAMTSQLINRSATLVADLATPVARADELISDVWLLSMLSTTGVTGLGRPPEAQTLWYLYATVLEAAPHCTKGEVMAALLPTYVREISSSSPVGQWLGSQSRLESALGAAAIDNVEEWLSKAGLPAHVQDIGLDPDHRSPHDLAQSALAWMPRAETSQVTLADLSAFFTNAFRLRRELVGPYGP